MLLFPFCCWKPKIFSKAFFCTRLYCVHHIKSSMYEVTTDKCTPKIVLNLLLHFLYIVCMCVQPSTDGHVLQEESCTVHCFWMRKISVTAFLSVMKLKKSLTSAYTSPHSFDNRDIHAIIFILHLFLYKLVTVGNPEISEEKY